jgi:GT2 family glycosyltransferase
MPEKLVSIILLTWNPKRFLDNCLDSISHQDYSHLELIVVDNGSTDGSVENIRKRLESMSNIPWKLELLPLNSGFAAGMNRGIALSGGAFVLTLNQDVVLSPSYISKLVVSLGGSDEKNASATGKILKWDIAQDNKLDIIDSAGHEIFTDRIVQARGKNQLAESISGSCRVFGTSAAAACYSRDALNAVSAHGEFFDCDFFSYLEDIDLDYRFILSGYDSMFVHDAIAWHALAGSGGRRSFSIRFKAHTNRYLVWVKNEVFSEMLKDLPAILVQELFQFVRTLFTSPLLLFSWFVFPSKAIRAARKGREIYSRGKDYGRMKPFIQSGRLSKLLFNQE